MISCTDITGLTEARRPSAKVTRSY